MFFGMFWNLNTDIIEVIQKLQLLDKYPFQYNESNFTFQRPPEKSSVKAPMKGLPETLPKHLRIQIMKGFLKAPETASP